jgi:hypothetical protein
VAKIVMPIQKNSAKPGIAPVTFRPNRDEFTITRKKIVGQLLLAVFCQSKFENLE